MNTTTAGIAFLASLIIALALVHVPLGDYMFRVYNSKKNSRAERVIYKAIGVQPEVDLQQKCAVAAGNLEAFFPDLEIVRSGGLSIIKAD